MERGRVSKAHIGCGWETIKERWAQYRAAPSSQGWLPAAVYGAQACFFPPHTFSLYPSQCPWATEGWVFAPAGFPMRARCHKKPEPCHLTARSAHWAPSPSCYICWLDHNHPIELAKVTTVFASRAQNYFYLLWIPPLKMGASNFHTVFYFSQRVLNVLPLTSTLEEKGWQWPCTQRRFPSTSKYYTATHLTYAQTKYLYHILSYYRCHWLWVPPWYHKRCQYRKKSCDLIFEIWEQTKVSWNNTTCKPLWYFPSYSFIN